MCYREKILVLCILGIIVFTLENAAFGQAFRRPQTLLEPNSVVVPDGIEARTLGGKNPSASSILRFFDFINNVFVFDIGNERESKAVGFFFTAPITGAVDSVRFLLMDDAQGGGIAGSGTLRIKMVSGEAILTPSTSGIDSMDVDFSTLESAPTGVIPRNNLVDLSGQDFAILEGHVYFFQFSIVNATVGASLPFVFDGGSADTSDVRYYPPRSFVYAVDNGVDDFFAFEGLCTGCRFPNVIAELDLSQKELVQFIHNVATSGPIDIYVDGVRLVDDLGFREATSLVPVSLGERTVEIVDGGDTDNTNPISARSENLTGDERQVAIAFGAPGGNVDILVQEVRVRAPEERVNLMVAHGGANLEAIDVRLLDETEAHNVVETVTENVGFGTMVGPFPLDAATYNLEIVDAGTGTAVDVYRLDLSNPDLEGRTLILMTSGILGGTPPLSFLAVTEDGSVQTSPVSTSVEEAVLPERFTLFPNYPNPFNPSTTIRFELSVRGQVRLAVHDMLGRELRVLADGVFPAGEHGIRFEAESLPSGVYLVRLETVGGHLSRRIVLLK